MAGIGYKSSLPGLAELCAPDDDGRPGTPAPAVLDDLLRRQMAARRHDECLRGVSLVGPHRDDVELRIGPLPAKGYASHGESWSLALALRLGSLRMLRAEGIEPVLVLDDVFAELDATRRDRLADAVADAEQVIVTAAVAEDVPARLEGLRLDVAMRVAAVPERVSVLSGPGVVDLDGPEGPGEGEGARGDGDDGCDRDGPAPPGPDGAAEDGAPDDRDEEDGR